MKNILLAWGVKRFRGGFFLPIAFSFLAICFAAFAGLSISFFRSANVIKKNVEIYNLELSARLKSSVDAELNAAIQRVKGLCYDKRVLAFAKEDDFPPRSPHDASSVLDALDVINLNSGVCNIHYPFIADMFIYFDRSNTILNAGTYYSPPTEYYNANLSGYGMDYDAWLTAMHSYSNNLFYTSVTPNLDIFVWKSVSQANRDDVIATVGAKINSAALQTLLGNMTGISPMHTYIVTERGDTVAHSTEAPTLAEPFSLDGSELFYADLEGVRSLITHSPSAFNGWHYVIVSPADVVLSDVTNTRLLAAAMLAGMVALTLFLLLYMRKKTYDPVRRLVARIKTTAASGDEIQLISETLDRISNEHDEIKKSMDEHINIIKNNRLTALLRDEGPLWDAEAALAEVEVRFRYGGFMVLCIEIEEIPKADERLDFSDSVLTMTVITNIAEDIFRAAGDIRSISLERGTVALILNCAEDARISDTVCSYAEEFVTVTKNLFQLVLTMGVSGLGSGFESLTELYRQSREALTYKFLTGINSVNQYRETAFNASEYFYPLEFEQRLINIVAAGSYERAMELLDMIFAANFKQRTHPVKYSRCLFFDIISTVLKLLGAMKLDRELIFGAGFDVEKELIDCQTADEAYASVSHIIKKICAYVRERAKNKDEDSALYNAILSYIGEHFTEDSICIASVSQAVSITQTYLMHYFKEKSGETVMRYIENLRVERTKRLLSETGMKLEEIAAATGFTSSHMLIRSFKKTEGVTPGEFRKAHGGVT